MTSDKSQLAAHDAAMCRLRDWLRLSAAAELATPRGPILKELDALAALADELAQRVEDGPASLDIELARTELGFDSASPSLRALADCARFARGDLANPRARHALPRAASAYLHLLHREGNPRPSLYEKGEAVQEFLQLLEDANVPRSASSARQLLTDALKDFDPFGLPPGIDHLLP